MKITLQLLQKRSKEPLESVKYLNLSKLGIGAVEGLENCPNVQSLDLSFNSIEEIEGIDCCVNLWNLNIAHNQLCCLSEISRFQTLGTLDLSNNNLEWRDLIKIRHVIILDLWLHGNDNLVKDNHYRFHVIDCLPNVWMLDGRIITSAERMQVQQFFQNSALSEHPVRHKIPDHSLLRKDLDGGEIHGVRTSAVVKKFPVNESHSSETDARRLQFLAENMQNDFSINLRNLYDKTSPVLCILEENIITELMKVRCEDREKSNLLLLLMVASLEFRLPNELITETLVIAKLHPFFHVNTAHIFLLDRSYRIRLVSLLLSASKLDNDTHSSETGGLYDRLYICLWYMLSDLIETKRRHRKDCTSSKNLNSAHSFSSAYSLRPNTMPRKNRSTYPFELQRENRILLSSETTLLFSIIPSFYKHLIIDRGIQSLLQVAVDDDRLTNRFIDLAKDICEGQGDINQLYDEITSHVVQQIQRISSAAHNELFQVKQFASSLNTGKYIPIQAQKTNPEWRSILSSKHAYPKRPKSAILMSGEHLTTGKRRTSSGVCRKYNRLSAYARSKSTNAVTLGSNILLGPQNMARVIAMPDPKIALVQMNSVPALNGSVVIQTNNDDDHYCYVDVTLLELDKTIQCWKPYGAIGDKVTLQSASILKRDRYDDGRGQAFGSKEDMFETYLDTKAPFSRPQTSQSKHSNKSFRSIGGQSDIDKDIYYNEYFKSDRTNKQPRPLSAVYKERMDLHLPSQFSDAGTESVSLNRNEDTMTLPSLPSKEINNFLSVPSIQFDEMLTPDPGDVTLVNSEVRITTHAAQDISDMVSFNADEFGDENPDDADIVEDKSDNETEHKDDLSEEENLKYEDPQIVIQLKETNESKKKENLENNQELEGDDPELTALYNSKKPDKGNWRRAKSARYPKQAKVVVRRTRPISAIIGHSEMKKMYGDDIHGERPDSASSFQFERTEAWRSSASSFNLTFDPKSSIQTQNVVTQFADKLGTTFHIVSPKPIPPQRPTSPKQTRLENSSPQTPTISESVPKLRKSKSGIMRTANNWLADGKDLHKEFLQTRVYMTPRLPGYLETADASMKLMSVTNSLPLTTSSLSYKENANQLVHSCGRTNSPLSKLRSYLPPGIGIPLPPSKPSFSSLSGINVLCSRYPIQKLKKTKYK